MKAPGSVFMSADENSFPQYEVTQNLYVLLFSIQNLFPHTGEQKLPPAEV